MLQTTSQHMYVDTPHPALASIGGPSDISRKHISSLCPRTWGGRKETPRPPSPRCTTPEADGLQQPWPREMKNTAHLTTKQSPHLPALLRLWLLRFYWEEAEKGEPWLPDKRHTIAPAGNGALWSEGSKYFTRLAGSAPPPTASEYPPHGYGSEGPIALTRRPQVKEEQAKVTLFSAVSLVMSHQPRAEPQALGCLLPRNGSSTTQPPEIHLFLDKSKLTNPNVLKAGGGGGG